MTGTREALARWSVRSSWLGCAGLLLLPIGCDDSTVFDDGAAGNGEVQVSAQPLGVVQGHVDSHLNTAAAESVVTTMGTRLARYRRFAR